MASESSRPSPLPTAPRQRETVTPRHLRAGRAAVAQHLHKTPLVGVGFLARRLPGVDIRAKLETRQIMGSFKTRGAVTRLSHVELSRYPGGVLTASAGNHGLGVGWAANVLGLEATVVVPRSIPENKRLKLEDLVRLSVAPYEGYDDTERYARGLAQNRGALFVSAFDDPFVIAGNGGTVAEEILVSWPECQAIVCPVGGGGLASGIIRYCEEHAPHVRVIGVQSETNDAMAQSIALGLAIVSLPATPTLAEGLEGGVSQRTFEICRRGLSDLVLVSEEAIGEAMARVFHEMGEVLEGSAAVTVAALLEDRLPQDLERVALVFTGRNVDSATLDAQLDAHLGPSRVIGKGER